MIWRLCFTVSGTIASRTSIVNATIASPKLENVHEYSNTSPFIIGWMMTRFQMSKKKLRDSTLFVSLGRV